MPPSPSSSPSVAIAVVSWNTRDLLNACLRSLESDVEQGRAEVWVVDNGSTDGSRRLVEERYSWARLIASTENLGFGRAVNRVARETSTAWIAPANADIALEDGALERLLSAGAAHKSAGAVAPRLILPDGSTQRSVFPFPTLTFTVAHNLGLPRAVPGLAERLCVPPGWDPDRCRSVDWAVGAFLIVRREAWEAAGGFDPAQWMYAEDMDLGWRLARAGWSTRYEPSARVRHVKSAAAGQAWGQAINTRWMAATYLWMLRRRGSVVTRCVALVNVAGAGVRWAPRVLLARIRPSRWSTGRDWFAAWMRFHASGLWSRQKLERRSGAAPGDGDARIGS